MGPYQVNYQMFPDQIHAIQPQFNSNNLHPLQLPFYQYQHTERTGTGVFLPSRPGTGVFLPRAPTQPRTGVPPKRSTNNGKKRGEESITSFGQRFQGNKATTPNIINNLNTNFYKDSPYMENIRTQPPSPKHLEAREDNEDGGQFFVCYSQPLQ
uniref:Uncharacterized protein n=1 Tax=Meloidogyne floridensis TaxID=298350 RepID=A0A915NPD1_9BILA